MKALVFRLGPARFALPLEELDQVLAAAALTPVPLAPPIVAGLLNLHGATVPVLDLAAAAGVAAGPVCYDTRIALVTLPAAGGRPLGLLLEHVSGVASFDAAALHDSGLASAPFLGQVVADGAGTVQLVRPAGLLTPAVRALLDGSGGAA